ncbi:MAG: hypothetical protein CM15mP63_0780 [Gammaproteobacteria bacterium]|nr:MAG: hypothetical protein CM15mP63_0780 [Gammaproteobacteria bacterium]
MIEDCAQSFGANLINKQTGTFGDFGCFSFFQLKILVVMEMEASSQQIVVNSKKLQMLRNHGGLERNKHIYVGYNSD